MSLCNRLQCQERRLYPPPPLSFADKQTGEKWLANIISSNSGKFSLISHPFRLTNLLRWNSGPWPHFVKTFSLFPRNLRAATTKTAKQKQQERTFHFHMPCHQSVTFRTIRKLSPREVFTRCCCCPRTKYSCLFLLSLISVSKFGASFLSVSGGLFHGNVDLIESVVG